MGEGDITLGVRGISYWAEEAMACRQQSVKEGRGGVRMKPVSVQRAREQKYATWERRLWSTDDSAPCKLITTVDASDASNVERLIGSEGARVRDDEACCAASSIERVLATVEVERSSHLTHTEATKLPQSRATVIASHRSKDYTSAPPLFSNSYI